MSDALKDVHTEHCCSDHGCKYGDGDCTVTTGVAPQSYPCEFCDWEREEVASWLPRATDDELRAEVARRYMRFADEVNMHLLQITLLDARQARALRGERDELRSELAKVLASLGDNLIEGTDSDRWPKWIAERHAELTDPA